MQPTTTRNKLIKHPSKKLSQKLGQIIAVRKVKKKKIVSSL